MEGATSVTLRGLLLQVLSWEGESLLAQGSSSEPPTAQGHGWCFWGRTGDHSDRTGAGGSLSE